ncbi:hypothetical protein GEV01_14185 [Rugamonas sp. FT103W]|uniref:Heparinase II C-terminal domain-containing protein n=2 Tax=Rugamonas rivuli TaxID=2743358 RepID=A0A843SJY8_9BURK|nr:hypothetical protein [Rugamonas rivuli]
MLQLILLQSGKPMPSLLRFSIFPALLFGLGLSQLAHAATFPTEVIFEAEPGTAPTLWESSNNPALEPSTQYLMVTGKPNQDLPSASSADELTYTIDVKSTGTHKIWLRVWALGDWRDSFHLAIDDGSAYTQYWVRASPAWQWFSIPAKDLKAGPHKLRIKYAKSGLGLDRLLVTRRLDFVPRGLGENPTVYNSMPANPYPAPTVLPPAEHPRLFVRSTDLPLLRELETESNTAPGIEYAQLKAAWRRLRDNAAANPNGVLPTQPPPPTDPKDVQKALDSYCVGTARPAIQAKALSYLVDSNTTSGQQAINMMNAYWEVCKSPDSRTIGEGITLMAMVYDWAYPLLGTEQKTAFIERFMALAPQMEFGFADASKQGAVVGHGSEAQLMRDQLSAGVAFYDEAPQIYQITAGRFFQDFVAPRNFAYAAGTHHQGDSYGPYRYSWDMFASWIFRRMGAGDVFDASQQSVPYQWLYIRRPDGQLMRDGDSYQSVYTNFLAYWTEPNAYMLSGVYYNDPYIKHEFAQQLSALGSASSLKSNDIWQVLFSNPRQSATPAKALPLSRYFADPAGLMVARTGWTDSVVAQLNSPVAIATMKVGSVRFANHQHLDAGHFQLYYKGPLAIDSGIYEGKTSDRKADLNYGSLHDSNYHKRTIAHNAMLVFDRAETFAQTDSNDGGQRFVAVEPATLTALLAPQNGYITGSSQDSHIGPDSDTPDYSYLKGDIAKAYTSKVVNYTRSFVFLNLKDKQHPAALVVLDKIKSYSSGMKKTWLLHSEQEPAIAGDTVTILRNAKGYNGKLINRTILPAGASISKVGGSGNEFSTFSRITGASINYPIVVSNPANSDEPGAWRVEVSPATDAEADVFLNTMQVMDADSALPALATAAIASDELNGVQIGNRAVLFSKTQDYIASKAGFILPTSQSAVRVLVTDLAAGYWSVNKDNVQGGVEYEVKSGQGVLYFDAGTGGKYTLSRADTRTLPAPPPLQSLPLPN